MDLSGSRCFGAMWQKQFLQSFFFQRNSRKTGSTFHAKLAGGQFFLFSSLLGEDEPILTSIFFKGVGSTTNKYDYHFVFGIFF